MYPFVLHWNFSSHLAPTLIGSLQGTAAELVPLQIWPFCGTLCHVGRSPTNSLTGGGGGFFLPFRFLENFPFGPKNMRLLKNPLHNWSFEKEIT